MLGIVKEILDWWHLIRLPIEVIDLEKTYIGDFNVGDSVSYIIESAEYKYESSLMRDSRHVSFLRRFKDKRTILDAELKATAYYDVEVEYAKEANAAAELQALEACRTFLSLYQHYCSKPARQSNYLRAGDLSIKQSKDSLALVFSVAASGEYMILDGHHRLACEYTLGHKFVRARIAGVKKNKLQARKPMVDCTLRRCL
jgi:hypothetical protein